MRIYIKIAEHAHDDVTLGVAFCLLRGDPPRINKMLDIAVVFGTADQLTAPQQISARIPHMGKYPVIPYQAQGFYGSPHTGKLALAAGFPHNGIMRSND